MRFLPLSFAFLLAAAGSVRAQDFKFEPSEFEKKPYEFGGFVEGKGEHLFLDRDSAFYRLNDPTGAHGSSNDRATGTLELYGTYTTGITSFGFRAQGSAESDAHQGGTSSLTLLEGTASLKPETGRTIEIGKKTLKWGKGYAWNPAGFVERPKDPSDPDLSREGFIMLTGDAIWSFPGAVRTVAITPVLLPVESGINEDFGQKKALNVGGKLYVLAYDTDIDLMFLGEGTRSARYGADASRNLTSNLEVHGEVALVANAARRVLGSNNSVTSTGGDAMNWLVGLRYLTETDTTYIAEYYRNGAGFTGEEGEDFFSFSREAADAYAQTGATSELDRARSLSNGGFGRPNAFRDYLYLRASQKDPWDILYFTPAFTVIANLHDHSFMAMPELLYTGITNWEFRLRASANLGGTGSEYGEKQSAAKLELRIRRYF